ncbi:HicB family toxin-antitoxin system [Nocardia rhizosphaerihabitans]|uniref:HicB family toxin-antitoxin system n=1 Tax=Nocardia rhizosphaerihabitans TaxID=1691570 RepID=UPI003670DEDC
MIYTACVERGERYWLVHILEIDQWTQARTLQEVEPMARDLIGVMQEVSTDSFDLAVQINLPEAAREKWERSKRILSQIDELKAAAAAAAAAAAQTLAEAGLSQREIGLALGVSHQRAAQLVNRKAS